jgi:hypothetical protein
MINREHCYSLEIQWKISTNDSVILLSLMNIPFLLEAGGVLAYRLPATLITLRIDPDD